MNVVGSEESLKRRRTVSGIVQRVIRSDQTLSYPLMWNQIYLYADRRAAHHSTFQKAANVSNDREGVEDEDQIFMVGVHVTAVIAHSEPIGSLDRHKNREGFFLQCGPSQLGFGEPTRVERQGFVWLFSMGKAQFVPRNLRQHPWQTGVARIYEEE